ncbi:hypothetical protein KIN20_001289 [Parelaphostrongylus tenuis]|uniref:C2H2-type domain-containing protein n=1 Tax=Parelaphostrongylus tenuis TaxID=148309 RepID=A0AAD5QEF5_PARTN|nr:hypothetical protein KIN20_001289 [Parelaphostrongylus tenuis]
MKDEIQCEAREMKCETYESKVITHEGNFTEPQSKPGQTLTVEDESVEDLSTLKAGENRVYFAADLLGASSSVDVTGDHMPPYDNVPFDKEISHKGSLTKPQFEPEQVLIVKVETGKDSLTVKEETGENRVCYATDLPDPSSSADFTDGDAPPLDSLPSDEEKVLRILYAADVNMKKEHGKSFAEWYAEESNLPKQCMKCDKKFAFRFQLQRHISDDHESERLTCWECGRRFGSVSGLNRHKQINHRNHLFICSYEGCNHPGYKSNRSLLEHIRSVHTHDRPYVCTTCGKAFITKNRLRDHSYMHSSSDFFHCKCGTKFRRKRSLYKHQRQRRWAMTSESRLSQREQTTSQTSDWRGRYTAAANLNKLPSPASASSPAHTEWDPSQPQPKTWEQQARNGPPSLEQLLRDLREELYQLKVNALTSHVIYSVPYHPDAFQGLVLDMGSAIGRLERMGENMILHLPELYQNSITRNWGVTSSFQNLTSLSYETLRALAKILRTIERLHDNMRHLRATLTIMQQEDAMYEMSLRLRQSRGVLEPWEPPREYLEDQDDDIS